MMKLNAAAVLILSAVIASSALAAVQQDGADSRTRDQVRAEVLAARAAGTLEINEANYPRELTTATSTVTRAEVMAETIRARAAGELDWNDASYPLQNAQTTSTVTRTEVLAETIRARLAGELDITEATPSFAASVNHATTVPGAALVLAAAR